MGNSHIKWLIFFVTVVGNFIAMLDSSSVNVALYEISQSLNVKMTDIQWVVSGYMLTLTVLLPLFGKLGDIYSRNKLYSCGFLIFALGALLSFTAKDLHSLIFYRCIEASGASILLANASAIIASIFKNAKRGKALGFNGAVIAVAGMSGPTLGGIIIHFFGWNAIFLPTIPIALLGAYYSYKMIPSYHHKVEKFKFDYLGFGLLAVFLTTLLLNISKGHQWGWTSDIIILLTVICVVAFVLFLLREEKSSSPIIDLNMFKVREFAIGNIALLISYLPLFMNGILFPFYAQEYRGFSPMLTGLLILPFSIVLTFAAPICGNIAGKKGSKYLTVAGGLMFALGLLCFAGFNNQTTIVQIIIAQVLMGIGNGLFQSPSNMAILSSVDKNHLGIASSMISLFRNTGMVMGIAVGISVFSVLRHKFMNSEDSFIMAYHGTLYVSIIFALLCSWLAHKAYKNENLKTNN